MKKILTLILLSVFILSVGCTKSEPAQPELKSEVSLIGTWELRKIRGVQVAGVTGVFEAGNGRIIKFSDKNYLEENAGIVEKSGTYTMAKESSWTDSNDRLIYDNDKDFKRFVSVEDDKLTIYMGSSIASDGWEQIYERLSNTAN